MNYKEKSISLINERFDLAKIELEQLIARLVNISKKPDHYLCLFGAGNVGKQIYFYLSEQNIKVDFFCDNNSTKQYTKIVDEIECVPLTELLKYKENVTVITCLGTSNDELVKQLMSLGINDLISRPLEVLRVMSSDIFDLSKDNIVNQISSLFDILGDELSGKVIYYKLAVMLESEAVFSNLKYSEIFSEPQYFPDIVELKQHEIFVDCGAYTGDTLETFIEQKNASLVQEYICYEFDYTNFLKLKNNVSTLPSELQERISLYNLGVSDQSAKIKYSFNEGATSTTSVGNLEGEVISLDEHLKGKAITFLKMDIEGSEVAALKGATHLIVKNHPTCAISIYHKASDLWEIPLLLKDLVSSYKIFIRHHTDTIADTVCYTI